MCFLKSALNNINMQTGFRNIVDKFQGAPILMATKCRKIWEKSVALSSQKEREIRSNTGVSQNQKTKAKVFFTFEITEKACPWEKEDLFSANKLQGGFCGCLD